MFISLGSRCATGNAESLDISTFIAVCSRGTKVE